MSVTQGPVPLGANAETPAPGRTAVATAIAHPAVVLFLFVLTLSALTAPSAGANTGGATIEVIPTIKKITCAAGCGAKHAIQNGSTIRIRGRSLDAVTEVVFLGGPGSADDVTAKGALEKAKVLAVTVPATADSGPIALGTASGLTKSSGKAVAIIPPPPIIATGELRPVDGPRDNGAPALETATSTPRNVYFGAARMVAFSFRLSESGAASVTVQLVRLADSSVVRTWTLANVGPGQVQTVDWDGTAAGSVQPDGRYAFRLVARNATGASASSATAHPTDNQRDAFDFHNFVFPIRGAHDYGSGGNRFGAQRPGHIHQGQDVMAKCGVRMVAARGGTVRFKGYHSAAGNYIVISGDESATDYVYMHLRTPSPFTAGDHVFTGQKIGEVGDTGDATACHLHFELWNAPGWYNGGKPFDPLATLQAWDSYS